MENDIIESNCIKIAKERGCICGNKDHFRASSHHDYNGDISIKVNCMHCNLTPEFKYSVKSNKKKFDMLMALDFFIDEYEKMNGYDVKGVPELDILDEM